MHNPCHSWPFLSLSLWVFSQEVEILVLAVHKDSVTEGGSCVFLKGKLLFKEGGKEQTETVWGGYFAQEKKKICSITAETNYTEKTKKKKPQQWRGESKACGNKMPPPRVEWQRLAFRFETELIYWLSRERKRGGWVCWICSCLIILSHHLIKCLVNSQEKKNPNTRNLLVPW